MNTKSKKTPDTNAYSGISYTSFKESLPQLGNNFAVAVSGGKDSMCLAYLLCRYVDDWNKNLLESSAVSNSLKTLHIISIDHDLRKESHKEAEHVCNFFNQNYAHVKCSILKWNRCENTSLKTAIQENAREARYNLLLNYCIEHKIYDLFIAHNMNDQTETFFMRAIRGTGINGLSSIKKHTQRSVGKNVVNIHRPLLKYTRQEIEDTITAEKTTNIECIEDPSNSNANFERVRMRNTLNEFRKEFPNLDFGIYESTQKIQQAYDALSWMSDRILAEITVLHINKANNQHIAIDAQKYIDLPYAIKFEVTTHIFKLFTDVSTRGRSIGDTIKQIEKAYTTHRTIIKNNTYGCNIALKKINDVLCIVFTESSYKF